MSELMERLRRDYDFVLLDSPAGIEHGFKTPSPAPIAIVVTTPEISAVRDADRIIGLLKLLSSTIRS